MVDIGKDSKDSDWYDSALLALFYFRDIQSSVFIRWPKWLSSNYVL